MTKTVITTNDRLAEVISMLDELMDWAMADAEHSAENGAMDTAKDDRHRVHLLKQAVTLLQKCER